MSDSPEANLMKKRARRRLLGSVAFAGLAAVVLPMVMDEEPRQQVQDVQIKIPGQDQTPFAPKVKPTPPAPAESTARPVPADKAVERPAERPVEKVAEKPAEKAVAPTPAKPAEKPAEKSVEKPSEKSAEKPAAKATEKSAEKPAEKSAAKHAGANDAQRASAILSGKPGEAAGPAGQYVILIGAFSNPGNVKVLQTKLGEQGIKVYTESLETPDGKKTRVRAGPFASHDAAEKALDKMKRIGVNGVIAAKQ